ncbi:hypothetical protein [Lonsdalea quercina]|uniref:hypothetical protein n=1 Tax=Lonsdalea quercina TaxID=71657 RepID=UPI003976B37C
MEMKLSVIVNMKMIALMALFFVNVSAAKTSVLSDEQVKKQLSRRLPAITRGIVHALITQPEIGAVWRSKRMESGRGYAPICYGNEVSKEMIKTWRSQH